MEGVHLARARPRRRPQPRVRIQVVVFAVHDPALVEAFVLVVVVGVEVLAS